MSKKLILCIFCSLACITMACSDDKDNDSYKEGAACTENRVGGIGGLCDLRWQYERQMHQWSY